MTFLQKKHTKNRCWPDLGYVSRQPEVRMRTRRRVQQFEEDEDEDGEEEDESSPNQAEEDIEAPGAADSPDASEP